MDPGSVRSAEGGLEPLGPLQIQGSLVDQRWCGLEGPGLGAAGGRAPTVVLSSPAWPSRVHEHAH